MMKFSDIPGKCSDAGCLDEKLDSLMPIRYCAALIDCDGTLLGNSEEIDHLAKKALFAQFGIEIDDDSYFSLWLNGGGGTKELIERNDLAVTEGLTFDRAQRRIDEYIDEYSGRVKPAAGALELLHHLRSIPKVIVTQNYRHRAELLLEKAGLRGKYDYLVSESDPLLKREGILNQGGKYTLGSRLLEIGPSVCLGIDNSPGGITAAREAGIGFIIACPSDKTKHCAFENGSTPHIKISSLDEAIPYLKL